MVKTGLDRQERVVQACQNIRILRHSLSQPVFSMFSHRFSSVFGLFTIVQGSVEAVQGRFCTFPIKIFLLIASLRSDWSNTTERFLYSTVFAAYKWKRHCCIQFSNVLTDCAAVQHMGHARKTWKETRIVLRRRQGVRSFNKGSDIRQLRCCHQLGELMDEDVFGDLLWDEPSRWNNAMT